jgi:hypothetical protein
MILPQDANPKPDEIFGKDNGTHRAALFVRQRDLFQFNRPERSALAVT